MVLGLRTLSLRILMSRIQNSYWMGRNRIEPNIPWHIQETECKVLSFNKEREL